MSEPIVVTGLGAVCPLGTGAREVWRALVAGESGVRTLAGDDERLARGVDPAPPPEGVRAGWVRGFRPREHVLSPQLRRMDWCSRMLVASVRRAFDDAALLPLGAGLAPRVALVVGSSYGNQRETVLYLGRVLDSGLGAAQPMLFPNLVLNAGAGYAAIELDVQGPNLCVSQHEASGEAAIATALDLLRSGACDVACAAGVDEMSATGLEALADVGLLHPDSAPPSHRRRATRRRTARVVPGEGSAALVLEPAAHAAARGARVYARLTAACVGAVAAPAYAYPTDAATAAGRLLELAGPAAAEVDALVAGPSGFAARDAVERALLRELGARQGRPPARLPLKALVGDWGALGALAAVVAALALDAGSVPGAARAAGEPCSSDRSDPRAVLVAGLARGGVLAPVVLARP